MPTPSEPLSPSSTSSHSLITSLDALSISTGSFDQSINSFPPSSASGSNHHRRTSSTGSHISRVSHGTNANGASKPRLSTSSEEFEVILLPRSSGASISGQSGKKGKAVSVKKEGNAPGSGKGSATPSSSGRSETDESVIGEIEGAGKNKKKPTRRSGAKARRRAENGQNRETEAVEDALELGTPRKETVGVKKEPSTPTQTRGTTTPSGKSPRHIKREEPPHTSVKPQSLSGLIRGFDRSSEEDEEDEVDGLSDLDAADGYSTETGSSRETPRSSPRRKAGSIMSADDARSSIDEFLSNPLMSFNTRDKLRFWQSLCYELGLADLDESPSLPDLPTTKESASSSRSPTPTPHRPMPQSLTKAQALLKAEGHVNLADYFDARSDPSPEHETKEAGRYSHLLYPTSSQMVKYTRKNGRFVQLGLVKAEVLQPLLRDFGFKKSRAGRG